uniref:Toprim domain-containing protein n=1 Tax=Angiostrongylus cantonensis TaxID=6313 RepID=A0A0K0D2V7_ANGCA
MIPGVALKALTGLDFAAVGVPNCRTPVVRRSYSKISDSDVYVVEGSMDVHILYRLLDDQCHINFLEYSCCLAGLSTAYYSHV